jgi:hypothetical protein
MLRAIGFASGNGFGSIGGVCDSVGASGMISSRPRVPSAVEEEEVCGGGGGGGNGGVVDGKRSGADGGRRVAGCGGKRDSGEGGGRTKEVGRSEVGTVEGMTSVSKDASTRLLVRRLGREPEAKRFADADDLVDFEGDLCASFALVFERVLRGERRDGPGCGAGAGAGAGAVGSNSAFFELGPSCLDLKMVSTNVAHARRGERTYAGLCCCLLRLGLYFCHYMPGIQLIGWRKVRG